MANTRKINIPGGGSFEVPMPATGATNVMAGAGNMLGSGSTWTANLVPVLLGGALGAGLTALVLWARRK